MSGPLPPPPVPPAATATPPPLQLPKGKRCWSWDHLAPYDHTHYRCIHCTIVPPSKKGLVKWSKTGTAANAKGHLATCHSDLAQMLEGKDVSFSMDGYKCRGYSLLSFVATYIDDSWSQCQVVLGAQEVKGSQTIARLVDECRSIFATYKISPLAGITDAAANAKGTIRKLGIISVLCGAHLINLAVKESCAELDEDEYELIERCRKISERLHRSAPNSEKFARILQSKGLPVVGIPQEICTRWNSLYFVIEACLRNYESINAMCKDLRVPPFSQIAVATLHGVLNVLRVPLDATYKLSRSQSTASETLPLLYQAVRVLLRRASTDTGVARELALNLVRHFTRRINAHKIYCSELAWCSYLDPRWAGRRNMLSEECDGTAWSAVREQIIVRFGGEDDDDDDVAAAPAPVSSPSTDDLFTMLDESVGLAKSAPTTGPSALMARIPTIFGAMSICQAEMQEYEAAVGAARPPSAENPTDWWRKHHGSFHLLAAIARKLLSIPSTSVNSERLFSVATSISANRKRNRLSAKAMEDTMMISCNRVQDARLLHATKPRPVRLLPRASADDDDGHTSLLEEDSEAEDPFDNLVEEEENASHDDHGSANGNTSSPRKRPATFGVPVEKRARLE